MLLIDKYTPKTPNDLIFNKDVYDSLKKISNNKSMPHLIFNGPPQCGKKTMIRFFLELLFDTRVNKTDYVPYEVSSGGSTTTIYIKQSNYHIEIEPNNNNFDKYLVQDVIKKYVNNEHLFKTKKPFKVVLIHNVDSMSYYAQTSLRRTMEKYTEECRFIMWCRSLSRIIDPLRSRSLYIPIKSPTDDELFELIFRIASEEKMDMRISDFHNIINQCDGKIKKAIWLLQCRKEKISSVTSYHSILMKLVTELLGGSIGCFKTIRGFIYNIIITNFIGSTIIKDITMMLINHLSAKGVVENHDKIKEITSLGAMFEHRLIMGRREIYHLEAFIVHSFAVLHQDNAEMKKMKKSASKSIIKKV